MIIILCTVSTDGYNDAAVEPLIHLALRANLYDQDYFYAVFHPETQQMKLVQTDFSKSILKPVLLKNHSIRYSCVYSLMQSMSSGDWLMVNFLSDLAPTAAEVKDLYFLYTQKGIQLSFYDASYLDSAVLELGCEPSKAQKQMTERIIENYFTHSMMSQLSRDEQTQLSSLKRAKKKSAS